MKHDKKYGAINSLFVLVVTPSNTIGIHGNAGIGGYVLDNVYRRINMKTNTTLRQFIEREPTIKKRVGNQAAWIKQQATILDEWVAIAVHLIVVKILLMADGKLSYVESVVDV